VVNLLTRSLLKSDGPRLLRGFHHGKSRSLVTRTSEFAIPVFPKRVISRHVASLNRTVHDCFGVSTMESPDLSSPGLPNSRFRFPETGNLATRSLLKSDGPRLLRGFHHGKSRSLVTRTSEFAIPVFPKRVISRHVASLNRTVHDYFGVFAPIHWGFDPRVSPDRSNDCRVFQPRSDGSDRFLTCAFSHDSLDVEKSTVQMFSWTLGIYDPDLFATHEDTERQSGKALTSYFLLPI
jgi:hypothetical protein